MAFFIHKIPVWVTKFYPEMTWRIPTDEKVIYLTFDDGPVPEATDFALETLERFQAKATFFCIGDNISKHPEIFNRLLESPHTIGNHTHNHLKGWETEDTDYLQNIAECQVLIPEATLFRPPYGRIKKSQSKEVAKNHEIVMWDVLSGDYSPNLTPQNVLNGCIKSIGSGSIVVFHDSRKAFPRMSYALPRVLDYFLEQGFRFDSLPNLP